MKTNAPQLRVGVIGTGPQAQVKDILILASGERPDFDRVQGVLVHFTRSVRYVGEFGAGTKVKYVANLPVAIHPLAAAEALVLGEKAGIAPNDASRHIDRQCRHVADA